jgi:hypothetical protein
MSARKRKRKKKKKKKKKDICSSWTRCDPFASSKKPSGSIKKE